MRIFGGKKLADMIYIPDRPWSLIKEFYFMKPVLDAKKLLAQAACFVYFYKTACMSELMWREQRQLWEDFEQRSHPHTISGQVLSNNMNWDYNLINDRQYYFGTHKFVNMFQKPGVSNRHPGLTVSQWKKLLKMNGVKGYSKMSRIELIQAYIKL